jgi:hypothetical protein
MTSIERVARVYEGSDGDATKGLYAELEQLGSIGVVAVNLFRACKTSERAKTYRRRSHKSASYDRKQWSMDNLAATLREHAGVLNINWGWGLDTKQEFHCWVLYVDLPTGQVSFHTAARGAGPTYGKPWDGVVGASAGRICSWVARLLDERRQERDALAPDEVKARSA